MKKIELEKATLGAGCFWHVEAEFRKINGVKNTAVGYEGGNFENPSYENVCTDNTGHAEVIEIEFDPKKVSYDKLLEVFWNLHDPTTLNRQGPDVGTQYRSVIFYHNEKQKKMALASKEKLQKSKYKDRNVVTEIVPAKKFYKAEGYHQRYLEKKGLFTCRT